MEIDILIFSKGKFLKEAVLGFDKRNVIYKITNTVSDKIYIGRSVDIKARIRNHKKDSKKKDYVFCRAVRKYGWENFNVSIIDVAVNFNELLKLEVFYSDKYKTIYPDGYNNVVSNEGCHLFSDETKNRISKSNQGVSRKKNKKYVGVSTRQGTYYATFRYNKRVFRKKFDSFDEAIEAYDKCVLYSYGESARINKEFKRQEYLKLNLKEYFNNFLYSSSPQKNNKIGYTGIFERSGRFAATYKNKRYGTYNTLAKAALIRDKVILYLEFNNPYIKLNFPKLKDKYKDRNNLKVFYDNLLKNIAKTSKYKGVYLDKERNKWVARPRINDKIKPKRFDSEDEAAFYYNSKNSR